MQVHQIEVFARLAHYPNTLTESLAGSRIAYMLHLSTPTSNSPKALRILIVEEFGWLASLLRENQAHPNLRAFSKAKLSSISVEVEWKQSCAEALVATRIIQPDLIIVEVGLPDGCGTEIVDSLLTDSPHSRILGFSALMNERTVKRIVAARFHGFIPKSYSTVTELRIAIPMLLRGESYYSPIFDCLRKKLLRDPQFHGHFLTNRELEVLEFVAQGFDDAEVAEALMIATGTAHKHRQSLMRKLDVRTSLKLLRRALQLGYGRITSPTLSPEMTQIIESPRKSTDTLCFSDAIEGSVAAPTFPAH
ncbi:DNA-binding response regulator [Synoicihabitans lomoniglobus]|uniref:DNA-binding response regulator n=1 Tax=Synoicihabitans lomoniglobus TaxID=2909285 RepID=A0AAF0I3Z5_9BACT|nr:DNA-binding response regulator [Opitutaceae bacterium LMO-M01]